MTTKGPADSPAGTPPSAAGHASRNGIDPQLLVDGTDDEILRRYLDLVRKWRGAKLGSSPRLRQTDVAVLVSILGRDSAEIERRLIEATACSKWLATRGRRLLLASVGGALISLAAGTIGTADSVTRITAPATADQHPTRRAASAADEPSVAAPEVPSAAVARSVANDEASLVPATIVVSPPGMEATVSIPSLGIDLPVVEGGQAVIDQGVVAHYVADGWKDPVEAGAPGTYWLAAHHMTHGGPFAALADVSVGAPIVITAGGNTFVYTVTSTAIVGLLPGDVAIYGVDESAPSILLQTCIDATRRFLVHGTLTATFHG